MTDAIYPQARIFTERFMNPDTVERLLNQIFTVEGIRRIVLNGQRLPSEVPYGPAKGKPNPHTLRRTIKVGDQEIDLQVQVGTILLELENRDVIPALEAACAEALSNHMSFRIQEGRYMKTEPSLVDYAKYGPDAEKSIIGMADPKSRKGPVIIQGIK